MGEIGLPALVGLVSLEPEYAAITVVAKRLGMTAETLRKWIRQAEIDEGQASGVSSEAAREIRGLRRKNRELEQVRS